MATAYDAQRTHSSASILRCPFPEESPCVTDTQRQPENCSQVTNPSETAEVLHQSIRTTSPDCIPTLSVVEPTIQSEKGFVGTGNTTNISSANRNDSIRSNILWTSARAKHTNHDDVSVPNTTNHDRITDIQLQNIDIPAHGTGPINGAPISAHLELERPGNLSQPQKDPDLILLEREQENSSPTDLSDSTENEEATIALEPQRHSISSGRHNSRKGNNARSDPFVRQGVSGLIYQRRCDNAESCLDPPSPLSKADGFCRDVQESAGYFRHVIGDQSAENVTLQNSVNALKNDKEKLMIKISRLSRLGSTFHVHSNEFVDSQRDLQAALQRLKGELAEAIKVGSRNAQELNAMHEEVRKAQESAVKHQRNKEFFGS